MTPHSPQPSRNGMPPGQRDGNITKDVLRTRIANFATSNDVLPTSATSSVSTLLGHAIYYGVANDLEVTETVPRVETTIPCYLQPRIHHMPPGSSEAIEKYVQVASTLFHRQGVLANLVAQGLYGRRTPPENGSIRRFDLSTESTESRQLWKFVDPSDVRNSAFKQLFLPERWPSANVPLDENVRTVLQAHSAIVPSLPDWKGVMSATGWDNAINRAATKYRGNIEVQVCTGLLERVKRYLDGVELEDGTDRARFKQLVTSDQADAYLKTPTTTISVNDSKMAFDLRMALGAPFDDYPPKNAPWTASAFALHVFLVRYGSKDASYLPVPDRGRKYCYIDAKIADALFPKTKTSNTKGKTKSIATATTSSAALPTEGVQRVSESICIGDMLGLTPRQFNSLNKSIRSLVRRKLRTRRKSTKRLSHAQKQRLKRRERALRYGKMPTNGRVDSLETDGVGLRLCVKTPVDIKPFIRCLPTVEEVQAAKEAAKAEAKRKRDAKKKSATAQSSSSTLGQYEQSPRLLESPNPIFMGCDTGRKKLFTIATSAIGSKLPSTTVFTRSRYYTEMKYWRHQRWSEHRASSPEVSAALNALSEAGGLKNCDPDLWHATLAASRTHEGVLRSEYLENKEYAVWKMRMFRKKRSSLDRAVSETIRVATYDQPLDRPLVLGLGSATFTATGRGELSAPTTSLRSAFDRALKRVRDRETLLVDVWEHRTTLCCCACGSVTTAPMVVKRNKTGTTEVDEEGVEQRRRSRRLRSCTTCETSGKRRDRDVQAARNILWLVQHQYFGAPRPEYMCRVRTHNVS